MHNVARDRSKSITEKSYSVLRRPSGRQRQRHCDVRVYEKGYKMQGFVLLEIA